jgi:hypothetical protein
MLFFLTVKHATPVAVNPGEQILRLLNHHHLLLLLRPQFAYHNAHRFIYLAIIRLL